MTAAQPALTRSSYEETFSVFSRPENCPSVSDVVLISGGRLFHADGPATEKLRGPKPAVLVYCTTVTLTCRAQMSTCIETAETGLIIDTRYGATSW